MTIFIRVDASVLIGSGHVMRCLTLAEAFRKNGCDVIFICRRYPGNLIDLLAIKGFSVIALAFEEVEQYLSCAATDDYKKWLWVSQEQDAKETAQILAQRDKADLLVIDHYGLDKNWEQAVSSYTKKIMVIDDLANREHNCNFLLDQNFYSNLESRYDQLVPRDCKKLLGPCFALLGPQFIKIREVRQAQAKFNCYEIRNILIFMGGADSKNVTKQVVEQLLYIPDIEEFHINVVVGKINRNKNEIEQLCAKYSFLHYHCQPGYYHDLLAEADLAIAAGGVGILERACIGLLSLCVGIAENQYRVCADVGKYGAHLYLGTEDKMDNIDRAIKSLAVPSDRQKMISRGMQLVDGLGLDKVVEAVFRE